MSPGRGPKVMRFSACIARFCSAGPEAGALSFFLASKGTVQARLRPSRNNANLPKLDFMDAPRRKTQLSIHYEPKWQEKLLSEMVLQYRGSNGVARSYSVRKSGCARQSEPYRIFNPFV